MRFPKIKIPQISFSFKKKKKQQKPVQTVQLKPLPKGVLLVGKHNLFKSSKQNFEFLPFLNLYIPSCFKEVALGYNLYFTSDDKIDETALKLISLKSCRGKILKILTGEDIQPKDLKISQIETKGAKKLVKKFSQRILKYPLTCEEELWELSNEIQKELLLMKLFKDFGKDTLLKAFEKWNEKHGISLCGLYRATIEELLSGEKDKGLREFLSEKV